jgi:hypothetical protein
MTAYSGKIFAATREAMARAAELAQVIHHLAI